MPTQSNTQSISARPDKEREGSPAVNGDFYRVADLLGAEDQALLRRVRTFMEGANHHSLSGACGVPLRADPGLRRFGRRGRGL